MDTQARRVWTLDECVDTIEGIGRVAIARTVGLRTAPYGVQWNPFPLASLVLPVKG
jgi:hypothetical protein